MFEASDERYEPTTVAEVLESVKDVSRVGIMIRFGSSGYGPNAAEKDAMDVLLDLVPGSKLIPGNHYSCDIVCSPGTSIAHLDMRKVFDELYNIDGPAELTLVEYCDDDCRQEGEWHSTISTIVD